MLFKQITTLYCHELGLSFHNYEKHYKFNMKTNMNLSNPILEYWNKYGHMRQ